MRLKKCVLTLMRKLVQVEMSLMSDAVHSRHVAQRWKRLCKLHEAEYVKRRSCRARWIEAGCRRESQGSSFFLSNLLL